MAEPPMTPVSPRAAGRQGRRVRALGVLLLVGLAFGVACSAAPSVDIPNAKCVPKICVAPDEPDGPPDGPSLCPAGDCNYQTQEGCPPDKTCAVHIDTATGDIFPRCVDYGLRKAGEPCDTRRLDPTLPADPNKVCARGLQCIGPTPRIDGGPSQQVCRKLCCGEEGAPYGDWRACDPGESCIRQIQVRVEQPPGSGTFVAKSAGVSFCVPVNNCDVLDSTSCTDDPVRPVCRIADPTGNVACQPPGSSDLGEPCERLDQCGPVQKCAQTRNALGQVEVGQSCRRLCRLGGCDVQACPASEGVCVHFRRDPAGVGECTPNFDQDTYCTEIDGGGLPPTAARADAGKG